MFSARLQLLVCLVSAPLLGCGGDEEPIAYEQVWLGPLQGDDHRDADAGEAQDASDAQQDNDAAPALDAGVSATEDAGADSSDAGEGEDSDAVPEPEQLQQQPDAGALTADAATN